MAHESGTSYYGPGVRNNQWLSSASSFTPTVLTLDSAQLISSATVTNRGLIPPHRVHARVVNTRSLTCENLFDRSSSRPPPDTDDLKDGADTVESREFDRGKKKFLTNILNNFPSLCVNQKLFDTKSVNVFNFVYMYSVIMYLKGRFYGS